MSKHQEFIASIGVGLVGIAVWVSLAAYLATKLSYPVVI